jgi:integral membrane protein
MKSPLGRMRAAGFLEACSFLVLVGVAMPLKYLMDMPEAVRWTGWCHGLLFVVYVLAILAALNAGRLPFKLAALAFLASLVPFGPFLLDGKLARLDDGDPAEG